MEEKRVMINARVPESVQKRLKQFSRDTGIRMEAVILQGVLAEMKRLKPRRTSSAAR